MLVTFHSKAWNSVTLFGDVAVTLLKMAGHSGTVPGALLARDIPAALEKLRQALATAGGKDAGTPSVAPAAADADDPPPVDLKLRAYPLIQLFTAAAQQACDVMWSAGAPLA